MAALTTLDLVPASFMLNGWLPRAHQDAALTLAVVNPSGDKQPPYGWNEQPGLRPADRQRHRAHGVCRHQRTLVMQAALLLAALLSLGNALAQPADGMRVDEMTPSNAVYHFTGSQRSGSAGRCWSQQQRLLGKPGPRRTKPWRRARLVLLAQGYALMGITASPPRLVLEQWCPEAAGGAGPVC